QLEGGSSPAALVPTLRKVGWSELATRADRLGLGSKAAALLEVVRAVQEPVLVFSRFLATLEALGDFLARHGAEVFRYHGGLPVSERERELRKFSASSRGVMLLSEVGGEGKNLQFCRHLVNFDLPWNPLRIEQRVGRVHRIGQTRPIQIVNLCLKGSLEDHLLRILDDKLNMFELVVGELESILGPLEEERDFEELLSELSAASADSCELERAMLDLEAQLLGLRDAHREHQRLDQELFGREFEIGEG
ncbi:MAG: C-terminal helicase domain-containing protein, partial [Candidatus Eremiobacterota bacterium]